MDSQEFFKAFKEVEAHGWNFFAFYHSHTHTEAYPSMTDRRLAAWEEPYYFVVSLQQEENPVIRAFRIVDENVTEEILEVAN